MHKYAIADYLTTEQKLRLCQAEYSNAGERGQPLTPDGCCPLGILDDELEYAAQPSAPDGQIFMWAYSRANDVLYGDDPDTVEAAIEAAADEFIDAWDRGLIRPADLPVVLGLSGEVKWHR